jgi:hypothetical protein
METIKYLISKNIIWGSKNRGYRGSKINAKKANYFTTA